MAQGSQTARIGPAFEDVIAAARQGADWAVAVLYRSLQPRLLRFLRAGLGADCEDVASQAWLEVCRALPRFTGGEDDFAALLFTVARRRATDHRRALRRRPPVADGGEEVFATLADRAATEDVAMARLRGEEAARRIAAVLPADQAEIVLLRVVGGFSADEVAAIVGRRAGTVRVLQHRALRRLAERLGDDL